MSEAPPTGTGTGTEVTDVPTLFKDAPLVWCGSTELPAPECEALLQRGLSLMGTCGTGPGVFQGRGRVQFEDSAVLARLEQLARPALPRTMGALSLVGLNPMMRFYRYTPGQRFPPHFDYWHQSSPCDITLVTVLLYLNEDFEGGATRFDTQSDTVVDFGNASPGVVLPKQGRIALWQHQLLHEGEAVTRGAKTVLRTDAVYRAPSPIGRIGDFEHSAFHRVST